MNVKEQITTLRNENKLCEAMMRRPESTYEERGNYGKKIIANNKTIKKLEKQLYQLKYSAG